MDANITVLKDGSLGGVEREYREVKRKARVGERIKVIAIHPNSIKVGNVIVNEVLTVSNVDKAGDIWNVEERIFSGIISEDFHGLREYVVLEPTDILRIDGARFRMVDRKAAVGERIIIVNWLSDKHVDSSAYKNGDIATTTSDRIFVQIPHNDHRGYVALIEPEYRVLEPVASAPLSAQPPLYQAAATIGALQAQIQALESRVSTLEKAAKVYARILDDSREEVAE